MKNNIDEKLIKDILQKGTEMKAPADLSSRILDRWQLEKAYIPSHTPIIPRLIWWILAILFASLFIWGFSNMSFPKANPELATLIEQVSENLHNSIIGFEGIVFPTAVVLAIMVLLNTFLLKYRISPRRVIG